MLDSIRETIVSTSPKHRRMLAVGLSIVYITTLMFITSESNPTPTLLGIIVYAGLIMFITRTFRLIHVWLPGPMLLFFVLPFAAPALLMIAGFVSTNISLREASVTPPSGQTKNRKES